MKLMIYEIKKVYSMFKLFQIKTELEDGLDNEYSYHKLYYVVVICHAKILYYCNNL